MGFHVLKKKNHKFKAFDSNILDFFSSTLYSLRCEHVLFLFEFYIFYRGENFKEFSTVEKNRRVESLRFSYVSALYLN